MAKTMFKQTEGVDEIETVIGPSVQVEGDFVTAGDVVVEGVVSGKLRTEKNLRVGERAKIVANVSATNALVSGEIQGNVKIRDNLELTSTARVFGDVKAKTIIIAAGAALHGKCQCGEDKKSKIEKIDEKPKLKLKEKAVSTPAAVK